MILTMKKYILIICLLIFSTSIYSQKIFEDTKDSALLQRQRDTLTYEVNVLNKPTYLIVEQFVM
jgi:hypothetical protein